ncbi:MAG TPA: hypothetical protein VHV74_18755 [Pseudonocardiaceae bacterium]|jgi:hypothetical protein|nr:hypothetical protein [Pseudonocardiaceae bacterium]
MTGIDRRGDTPMGPPWPVDVLAELHAGVFGAAVSDDLWPRVRHDADAVAVLDALDATRAELAGLATAAPPMPAALATRLDAAIAGEARTRFTAHPQIPPQPAPQAVPAPAPVADLAAARKRRNQRLGWAGGLLVAAAAVAVVVLAIPRGGSTVPGVAAPPPHQLSSGRLGTATLSAALGHTDYGPLSDTARRSACLSANGQDPNQPPAGALQVTLDGKPGTLLVLTTGRAAQYRLLVVGPDCAAGHPDALANTVVGGLPVPTR